MSSRYAKFEKRHSFPFFGTSYHLLAVDEYGLRNLEGLPREIEYRMYHFMKERGFKVKWHEWSIGGYMTVHINNKAHAAQFAMINAGIIEIEHISLPKLPVFKV
jgi:hypothetical protein